MPASARLVDVALVESVLIQIADNDHYEARHSYWSYIGAQTPQ